MKVKSMKKLRGMESKECLLPLSSEEFLLPFQSKYSNIKIIILCGIYAYETSSRTKY
jgi:hypothetical protein